MNAVRRFVIGWAEHQHQTDEVKLAYRIIKSLLKWSNWNAPGTQSCLSLIQFMGWVIPHFQFLAFWGNKNWPPSMKVEKLERF